MTDENKKPSGETESKPESKPDPQKSSILNAPTAGYTTIQAPGWGSMASIIPDAIAIDLDEALGISAYVKRANRAKLAPKDLERLVTNLTKPLEKHKFSALDFEKFQQAMDGDNCSSLAANTPTTSNILAHNLISRTMTLLMCLLAFRS